MADKLVKKQKDIFEAIKDKSLASTVSSLKTKMERLNKFKDKIILADVSGSMATFVDESHEIRAIDVVNHVLENFQGARLWEFSNRCKLAKNNKLSQPNSGTNMTEAFCVMKQEKFTQILLLTDGAPDDPISALTEAVGLKIDIVYIGPKPVPQFLLDLAKVGSNTFVDVELIKLDATEGSKQLENKIKGLLNA